MLLKKHGRDKFDRSVISYQLSVISYQLWLFWSSYDILAENNPRKLCQIRLTLIKNAILIKKAF
ncbi:MAG: hypothetical protein EWV75_14340 [Microcystis wesenbergii Mw_QC_S_20081001_S30D]|uniref:Uncharacterized protein n=2 Tax=Microcystis wesenbergii TaxID=44823 RepID=A0A552MAL4_9CHRO|nr:MAG: hypothetical protein EWV75_14340 [Microcystis wesenbergii Mw_QC_S_20081001_S30D]TRU98162.1 MAG: hypothetical protein EWV73_15610 [Microcystis wesenbergii Mw_QC_B_20070930_S4D]TRV05850.1 MAG: hypothetical protein EWV74_02080 [Microcystis wesenbergii Mw_QC_S_20081001_S30]TRV14718.1 MAG: hypothetical protein EWV41_00650 [Microcystis wesenbergii Mw_MB_S_20031200_S109]TRV16865.1 MAG: hypothetical protein EWV89_04400 [Microcystis wesenbergii Mw_QC_B_20070930_S4]TRV29508.1 MAG: hypothetical p